MKEIWKDVPWYEWKYQASTLWRIKSLRKKVKNWKNSYRIVKENIFKHDIHSWKYQKSMLPRNNKRLHQIIMLTFVWPSKWLDINHKNWKKSDNRLSNLEYLTHRENDLHKYRVLKIKNPMLWRKWKLNRLSKKVNQYDLN